MKKEIISIFSSPLNRACAYMLTFILGMALFELLRFVFHYSRITAPAFILIAFFVVVGIFVIHQRTLLSRITSASILLTLSFIAIGLNTHLIPSRYLLLVALAISYLGSRPFLHAKYPILQALVIGVSIVTIALLFIFAFVRADVLLA